jgi:ATP-dependent Lon protease
MAKFAFVTALTGGSNLYFLGQLFSLASKQFKNTKTSPFHTIKQKIEDSKMPTALKKELYEEINYTELNGTDEKIGETKAFINLVLNYPWKTFKKPESNLTKIQNKLDTKIFGMHKIKALILDNFCAYHDGRTKRIPPICLYGPPGTGKTAFAIALAKALNLPYIIISATGASDPDAFFRGSLRAYIGSAPGFFFSAFSQAQCINPLIIIDEIDKQAVGNHKGTIQNVLLQVLDPMQNKRFRDYYLNFNLDVSNACVVTTANDISQISDPLQDRMLMIKVDPYSDAERELMAQTIIWETIPGSHKIPHALKKIFIEKALQKTRESKNIRSLKKILLKKVNRWLRLQK